MRTPQEFLFSVVLTKCTFGAKPFFPIFLCEASAYAAGALSVLDRMSFCSKNQFFQIPFFKPVRTPQAFLFSDKCGFGPNRFFITFFVFDANAYAAGAFVFATTYFVCNNALF